MPATTMTAAGVRKRTWGAACALAAAVLGLVALVVLMSKATVIIDHPFSLATAILLVAAVAAIASAREARRSLT